MRLLIRLSFPPDLFYSRTLCIVPGALVCAGYGFPRSYSFNRFDDSHLLPPIESLLYATLVSDRGFPGQVKMGQCRRFPRYMVGTVQASSMVPTTQSVTRAGHCMQNDIKCLIAVARMKSSEINR